jgi:ABC-type cobalamin/Fe3+-siderophores transport system ATPase subunit
MLLRAESISYGYGGAGGFELRDVTIAIPKGSLTALLGPNGGGKTTLVSLLAGILQPQHGRVLLDDVDVRSLGKRRLARRVAVVPQETHPTFDYTVMEMVLMGRHPHLGPFSSARSRSRGRGTSTSRARRSQPQALRRWPGAAT